MWIAHDGTHSIIVNGRGAKKGQKSTTGGARRRLLVAIVGGFGPRLRGFDLGQVKRGKSDHSNRVSPPPAGGHLRPEDLDRAKGRPLPRRRLPEAEREDEAEVSLGQPMRVR